jgi:hypothetical protein
VYEGLSKPVRGQEYVGTMGTSAVPRDFFTCEPLRSLKLELLIVLLNRE